MYLKLMIDGAPSVPFSATTLPLQITTDPLKEKVIELSWKKYGKERVVVEKSIFDRYQKPAEENNELGLFDPQ
ncbi:MAG TPA: hypothetical protein VK483_14275 [Chitinophagaceae bacterium]|nr:hypothetical protein [Chitinophagaceae bacterium]